MRNKIGYIGAKYIGLALIKLIKLTSLDFGIFYIKNVIKIKLEILELNILDLII